MTKKIISIAAAFAVFITAGALGFNHFGNKSLAKISLDVNPSFEIEINTREKVTEIEAQNDDAKKVLGDMDLEGSHIDVAINALVGSIYKNGFLNETSNSVLISVDGENSAELQERLSKDVENAVNNFEVAVLTQSVSSDDELTAQAEKYGISLGKAKLIEKILKLDNTKTFEQLSKLSVNELNLLIHSDFDEVKATGSASEKAYIGAGNAKKAALKHAGVKTQDAKIMKAELDFEDGIMVYEVEFETDSAEYDYEVNAKDGSIINFGVEKKEVVNKKNNSSNIEKSSSKNNATTSGSSELIKESKAKKIALDNAGVKEKDIYNYKIELDRDDGVVSYEIEFNVGNTAYSYDIDAKSGKILDSEKEVDDDDDDYKKATSSKKTTSKSSSKISKSKAKNIALKDAGVNEKDIREYEISLDNDDGVSVYEIEFKLGNTEYSYEIDAKSGKIIDKEQDIDD